MKYSEYLEHVKTYVPEHIFICIAADMALKYAAPEQREEVKNHYKKLRKYIEKLLSKENALRKAAGEGDYAAYALNRVLGSPGVGKRAQARIELLNKYIAYHEARGN